MNDERLYEPAAPPGAPINWEFAVDEELRVAWAEWRAAGHYMNAVLTTEDLTYSLFEAGWRAARASHKGETEA